MKKSFKCRPYEETVFDIKWAVTNLIYFAIFSFLFACSISLSAEKSAVEYGCIYITGFTALANLAACFYRLKRVSKELN